MEFGPRRLHVCCVALGTRGDVQPVACIALHLQKTHNHINVSFITHAAHSSWLESSIYAPLLDTEYIDSPPAGGCWAPAGQAAPPAMGTAGAAAAPPAATDGPRREASLAQPDPRVVEAICNRIAAAAALASPQGTAASSVGAAGEVPPWVGTGVGAVGGTAVPAAVTATPAAPASADESDETAKRLAEVLQPDAVRQCPSQRAASLRRRLADLRLLLSQHEERQQGELGEQEQRRKQEEGRREGPAATGERQRHLVLLNLFALEGFHAAEALGLRCAVAAPYMIPYRCPAAFVGMFRRELPDLYDTLCRAAQLRQQAKAEVETRAAGAAVAAGPEAILMVPEVEEGCGRLKADLSRVTFAEVTHWMWPLFTERWGEWRSCVLGLPHLPLHRHVADHHHHHHPGPRPEGESQPESEEPQAGGGGGAAAPDGSGYGASTESPGGDAPLPLDGLPPAPPLLYGFSELLVPRPPYWPRSVTVCGFWQPPLDWFAGEQLPDELAALLLAPCSAEEEAAAAAAAGFPADPPPTAPSSPPLPSPPRACTSGSSWCLVDFGSSGRLGLIPDPLRTLRLLGCALKQLGMSAIVLTAGWQPLHQAAAELRQRNLQLELETEAPAVAEPAAAAAAAAMAVAAAAAEGMQRGGDGSRQQPTKRERPQGCGGLEHGAAGGDISRGEPARQQRRRTEQSSPRAAPGTKGVTRREGAAGGPGTRSAPAPAPAPAPSSRLHLYGGDVAHQLVLPYCRLVLHHAGSGTTAAALQCGVPQVTCPLHFDQHFWAERLAHLGLSPPPLDRDVLFGSGPAISCRAGTSPGGQDDPRVAALATVLRGALQPSRLAAARAMAQDLAAEGGGLQAAARALLRAAGD